MECKDTDTDSISDANTGFNRDIVECKVPSLLKYFAKSSDDLIETLWNVKEVTGDYGRWAEFDLIETLWNVKGFIIINLWEKSVDLIETLWNVKQK